MFFFRFYRYSLYPLAYISTVAIASVLFCIFISALLFASFTFDLSLLHQRLKRHYWLSFSTSVSFFFFLVEIPATSCLLLSCALCVLHFTLEYWSACLSLSRLILFGRVPSHRRIIWYVAAGMCLVSWAGRLVGCPFASWWPTSVFYFNVVIRSILLVPLIETKRMRRKVDYVESGSFHFFVIFSPQITHVHIRIHIPYI